MSNQNLTQKIRAMFAKGMGMDYTHLSREDLAMDNNSIQRIKDSSDNAQDLYGCLGNDIMIAGSKKTQQTIPVPIRMATPATQVIFAVPSAMNGARLRGASLRFGTTETTTTDLTAQLVLDRLSGTAPAAGVDLLTTAFDLTATADTRQDAALTANEKWRTLETGDRITFELSGSQNEVIDLVVTLYFDYGGRGFPVVFHAPANGDAVDAAFYIANGPRVISSIDYVHSTKGTDGSGLNVNVEKLTGTDAPGGGTVLLTDNSNAGFDCQDSNNVIQNGTLTSTITLLRLAAGDRLGTEFAGVTTALAGALIVIWVTAFDDVVDITYTEQTAAAQVDTVFAILDRNWLIEDARYVNSTAGSDGGDVNVQLTHSLDVVTAAAGTNLLTNDSSAGFDCKGTANTVEVAALAAKGLLFAMGGDTLGLDFAGTVAALDGVVVTVSLQPR